MLDVVGIQIQVFSFPKYMLFSLYNHTEMQRYIKVKERDFLGGPVVKTVLPLQGGEGLISGRELRSHMLWGVAQKN